MIKNDSFILFYLGIILIISQTIFSYTTFFVALPLLFITLFKHHLIYVFLFKYTRHLIFIFLLGLINGIINLYYGNPYFYYRDVYYFIQAPFFIFLGGYLSYTFVGDEVKLFRVIVIAIFLMTIYQLSGLFLNPSLLWDLSLESRYEEKIWNSMSIMVILILRVFSDNKLLLFKKTYYNIFLYISLFSVIISLSRVNYVILLFLYFLPFVIKRNLEMKLFLTMITAIIFIMFGGELFQVDIGLQGNTFQEKLFNSLSEMTVREYFTHIDISNNWRGYEAFLGLEKFSSGNLFQMFFGQGFGAVVHAPFWIFKGERFDFIPMFHNGYFTILLKAGFIGLIFFFLFLYQLLNVSNKVRNDMKLSMFSRKLLQGCVFVVILHTLVVHGIYYSSPPVVLLVLIGVTLGIMNKKQLG